ncbi:MAG TPA: carboxypeptidase-like regulatory domain-containing protein [Planctomycetota bacterium]|nr:carboxypeptidase-like regulatory domain-containing protein [Planctomycetota bacterium]
MRPLAVVVFAETLPIVLLGSVWLGGSPATAESAPLVQAALATDDSPPVAAALALPPVREPVFERQQVGSPMAAVAAGDPIGILVGGTVRSVDGWPIPSAGVTFRRGDEYHIGSTEPNGAYAALGLDPGEWSLTCNAEDFAQVEQRVTLDRRPYQQFDFELHPAYIVKVKIQNAAGQFVPSLIATQSGVELGAVASEAPLSGDLPITGEPTYRRFGAGEWHTSTNSGRGGALDAQMRAQGCAGELRLDHDPPVHVALVFRHYVLQSQPVAPGQHEVVFTVEADDVLGRLATATLRLVDGATLQPLPRARIELRAGAGAPSIGMTGDDGRAVLEHVAPGPMQLLVWTVANGFLRRHVRVPPGGTLDFGEVRMAVPRWIQVAALDAEGRPVTDAEVDLDEFDEAAVPTVPSARGWVPVDGSGQARLPFGDHRYVVFARSRRKGCGHALVDASGVAPAAVSVTLVEGTRIVLRCDFDQTVGYLVTVFDGQRTPVRSVWLGGERRPDGTMLPPGNYTVEIHDGNDRLVRSFALTVGREPLTLDVP